MYRQTQRPCTCTLCAARRSTIYVQYQLCCCMEKVQTNTVCTNRFMRMKNAIRLHRTETWPWQTLRQISITNDIELYLNKSTSRAFGDGGGPTTKHTGGMGDKRLRDKQKLSHQTLLRSRTLCLSVCAARVFSLFHFLRFLPQYSSQHIYHHRFSACLRRRR